MYRRIVIIGVGSFGGFLVENLSRIENLRSLILIDPDVVGEENINKSIYRKRDINKKKVDALKEIVQPNNENLVISCHPIEYFEGITYVPNSDLIIDCRDEICNRCGEIDVRFYIAYRTLVMDCKKEYKVSTSKTGRYIQRLKSSELSTAAGIAAQHIITGKLKDFINKQIVYQMSIDYYSIEASKHLEVYDNRPDIMLDQYNGVDKIRNLHENLPKIIEANKHKNLIVIVGENTCIGNSIQIIKQNEIAQYDQAAELLGRLAHDIVPQKEHYTIQLNEINKDEVYIELLPDTGAA